MAEISEPTHIVRTVQKRGLQGVEVNESKTGLAKRERSQASLCLEPLVVIEVNVFVNQVIGLLKCFELLAVDTFGFQNAKEIFCHCIVIAISPS